MVQVRDSSVIYWLRAKPEVNNNWTVESEYYNLFVVLNKANLQGVSVHSYKVLPLETTRTAAGQ